MTRFLSLILIASSLFGGSAFAGPWSEALAQKPTPTKEQPVQTRTQQILYFHSKSCIPCQRIPAELERLKKVGWSVAVWGESKTAFIMTVDGDRHPDMVQKYHVTAYPSFVLLVDDKAVDGLVGVQTAEQIAGLFNNFDPNPKAKAISRGTYEQILNSLGDSGAFSFNPSKPCELRLDEITSLSFVALQGQYTRSGDVVTVTFSGQQPRFQTKKYWMRVSGTLQSVVLDPKTNMATVKTSIGSAKIKVEFEE